MKKKYVSMLMLIVCLTVSGCTANTAENKSTINNSSDDATEIQKETSTKVELPEEMASEVERSQTTEEKQYTWQEITITLPDNWIGKCIVEENESGFSIYQKASYEKDNGTGYICGFYREKEYLNYGSGETLIAYTDAGDFYYFIQPTDFPCDTESEEVCTEYVEMCDMMENVKSSININASGVKYDTQEYVLPSGSICGLTKEVLADMSDNQLWIAKNEIYARHGRRFQNEYLQNYFNRCSWYEGTVEPEQFDEAVLSQLERDNLKMLVAAEQTYDEKHPYPKEYATTDTIEVDLMGNGNLNQVSYQVSDDGNDNFSCQITVDGTVYDLSDEDIYMISPIADVFYITDISEYEAGLEIAVLDEGPSYDPVTHFFRYDGVLNYCGMVSGFPFPEQNGGVNGFNGNGGIYGRVRMDLVGTTYLQGYWWCDRVGNHISYQDTGYNEFIPAGGHELYMDLPVYYEMSETSKTSVIPAQKEVFFMASDMEEWVLVKGKDGNKGYVHILDGKVTELGLPVEEVFSDLNYFD